MVGVLTPSTASAASSRNVSVQSNAGTPLSTTSQQTQGGRSGPYRAVAFDLTPCGDLPSLDAVGDVTRASEILNAYLVRVGDNGTCLWDPNFQGLCNPPLSAATEYRWVSAAAAGQETRVGGQNGGSHTTQGPGVLTPPIAVFWKSSCVSPMVLLSPVSSGWAQRIDESQSHS